MSASQLAMAAMAAQSPKQSKGISASLLSAAAVLAARALLALAPAPPSHYLAAHSHGDSHDHGTQGHASSFGLGGLGGRVQQDPLGAGSIGIASDTAAMSTITQVIAGAGFVVLARCVWALTTGKRRVGGGLTEGPAEVLLSTAQAAFFGITAGRVGALR